MKKIQDETVIDYSSDQVRFPALLEVTEQSDKLIVSIEQKIRTQRRVFYSMGIALIVLSVAVTQRLVLEVYVGRVIMDLVAYILPVLIAVDKFLGLDKRLPGMQEAMSSLSMARWAIYTDEKRVFTESGNQPVSCKFAGTLVKRLGDARNEAIKRLDEARLTR